MMKKTLLIFSLCASLLGIITARAQEETITVLDEAIFYGMYEGTVTQPIPAGAIRNNNSSYGKKLTAEEIASIGNTLSVNVTLKPLCDTYDRIGNVNLVLVPTGQTTYVYNEVQRIEIGRFITPFMNLNDTTPAEVPYVFEANNIAKIMHNPAITAEFDIWLELEVYGYQGDSSAGAVHDLPATCTGRNDVYQGKLELVSSNNPFLVQGDSDFFLPMSYKYELKNYTESGTDVVGQTVRSITFTLEQDLPNAKFYLITSNHGAQEEFLRRQHNVYLDGEMVSTYKPGGLSCVPYRVYNTMPNCIYTNCATGILRADTNAAWNWNNWCPGNKIPTRVIELGTLTAGEHTFKIDVPNATFLDNDGNPGNGYFPMSVYLQGYSETLGTEDFAADRFSLYPNPTSNIVNIDTHGPGVKSVTVVNTLGQTIVSTGATNVIDMSQYQTGLYIVTVTFDDNKTAVKKIVKE
jgi:hypothetical protein